MRHITLLGLALAFAGTAAQGCAVGQYFLDRGRDLTDVVRVQAGVGPGVGVNLRLAGISQAGLVAASVPRRYSVGWDYGRPVGLLSPADRATNPNATGGSLWDGEASLSAAWAFIPFGGLVMPPISVAGTLVERQPSRFGWAAGHWQIEGASGPSLSQNHLVRAGPMIRDGLAGWVAPSGEGEAAGPPLRLWSGRAIRADRRAHVHAFDVEASVYAGLVYARAGFSPGELVDFIAGWFGADIAGDDGRGWDVPRGRPAGRRVPGRRRGSFR